MVEEPTPYTHYRASAEAPVEPGIYRVVGRDAESVTLLRVADAEGSRTATGEVSVVDRDRLDAFADASDPDSGFRPGNLVDGMIEEVRMVLGWIRP